MNKNLQELKKSIADQLIDFADSEVSRKAEEARGAVRRDGGKALRAYSLTDRILDAVQQAADDMALKATGNCEHCYGKGYSSELSPAHVASSDMPDHEPIKRTVIKPSQLEYHFCKCERGQALKNLILTNAAWVLE